MKNKAVIIKFQYISCCSLSRLPRWYFIWNTCFNTSHVVVYQDYFITKLSMLRFQYISCCSLSDWISFTLDKKEGFNTSHVVVYRRNSFCGFLIKRRFNTSHVVVYRFNYFRKCGTFFRFNTSHVVVYQCMIYIPLYSIKVSIHLML